MRTVITYGTFDLLHHGHLSVLERARALGDYLIVGVTSDRFDRERGKLDVVQSTLERVDAVRSTGIANKVIVEEYEGQKIEDIVRYGVDVFTVGSDWRGHFDYLKKWCEVVYLDRTQGVSSTRLREERTPPITVGILGDERVQLRYAAEVKSVGGMTLAGCAGLSPDGAADWGQFDAMCDDVAAVIVDVPFPSRAEAVERALMRGKHVIYAPPVFTSVEKEMETRNMALGAGLVLFPAIKTLWFPAFRHLLLLLEGGRIGEIKSVELSCSRNPLGFNPHHSGFWESAFLDWGAIASMPMAHLLGTSPDKIAFNSFRSDSGCCYFTRCEIVYPNAVSSLTVGKGIKTEGDMVITGTEGYVYVPSPWWLTDYFEIRYEDLSRTRKFFWEYGGEGFRHELLEFVRLIREGQIEGVRRDSDDGLWETYLVEQFLSQTPH